MYATKLIFTAICWCLVQNSMAQKRWDGESMDDQWMSPENWFPDGVPSSIDDVELNNDFIKSSYLVKLPSSMTSVSLSKLSIKPLSDHSISLEIPEYNTISPALIANQICIENGGILLNKSGSLAGNTFQINGNMIIKNGGQYIHQTIRGNAYLISKLAHQQGTEKGKIIFKVPGNAGYLISMSGRTVGTVQFSYNPLTTNKIYSGSGNNDFTILGDLIIDENVQMKSSLTGNILIKGAFINNGICSLTIPTTDLVKRRIVFNGDSSFFINKGVFEHNNYFNGITTTNYSYLKLESALMINNPNATFWISTNASFSPGEYFVQGGKFVSDSASTIFITSADGLTNQSDKGNIRQAQINLNPDTRVIFSGTADQSSGNLFPDSLSGIMINKSNGNLTLTKNIHITDSIILTGGKVISNDTAMLSFSGKKIEKVEMKLQNANTANPSFIEGPLKYKTDLTTELFFPLGKDTYYAPILLKKEKPLQSCYTIRYHNNKSPVSESIKLYPLNNIDTTKYWEIKSEYSLSNPEKILIILNNQLNKITPRTNQDCIALFNKKNNNWNSLAIFSTGQQNSEITSIPFESTEGQVTFGQMRLEALPFSTFLAKKFIHHNLIEISWMNSLGKPINKYLIENSEDAIAFKTLKRISVFDNDENQEYSFKFSKTDVNSKFIRICAIDEMDIKYYSNILNINNDLKKLLLFPNPASKEFKIIQSNGEKIKDFWIVDRYGRRIKPKIMEMYNTSVINTERLYPGSYILQCIIDGTPKSFPFIKR